MNTPCAQLRHLENGIIGAVFNATLESAEDAKKHAEDCLVFTNGEKRPYLSDVRKVKKTSREARIIFASEVSAEACKAVALIIGSRISKIIGNVFMTFNKPLYPTKLFTDEEQAKRWLQQFCTTNQNSI